MEKSEIYKLMDMLDDLKKIDSLIDTHKILDESGFMVSQYESKKIKLIGSIIECLVSPELQSPQSFKVINSILQKYYPPNSSGGVRLDDEMAQVAAAI